MIRYDKATVAILCCAGVLAACASDGASQTAASASERTCLMAESAQGWTPIDDQTVNLRVGVNETYQLKLMGGCRDIDWTQRIGLESRGSSTICTGSDVILLVNGPTGPQRCPVQSLRKLEGEASR